MLTPFPSCYMYQDMLLSRTDKSRDENPSEHQGLHIHLQRHGPKCPSSLAKGLACAWHLKESCCAELTFWLLDVLLSPPHPHKKKKNWKTEVVESCNRIFSLFLFSVSSLFCLGRLWAYWSTGLKCWQVTSTNLQWSGRYVKTWSEWQGQLIYACRSDNGTFMNIQHQNVRNPHTTKHHQTDCCWDTIFVNRSEKMQLHQLPISCLMPHAHRDHPRHLGKQLP